MKYKMQVDRLVRSYENAVAFGGSEREPALQEAIKAVFSGLGDEGQAELYARIMDAWDGYSNGMVNRRLWIGQIVNAFMASRSQLASLGLKVHTNMPKPAEEKPE